MNRSAKKNIEPEESSIKYVQQKINPIDPNFTSNLESNFKTDKLDKISEFYEMNITKLFNEIKDDLTIPTKLDDLINFNMGIGLIREKYFKAYAKVLLKEKKLKHRLEVLEAGLIQEYKRNHEVHNGILLQKDEIKNLVQMNPRRIELQQEIVHVEVLLDLYSRAMDDIKNLSYSVGNQKELYKLSINMG